MVTHRSLAAWASLPPSPEASVDVLEVEFPDPRPLQSPARPSPVLPEREAKSDFPGILPTLTLPGWQVPAGDGGSLLGCQACVSGFHPKTREGRV